MEFHVHSVETFQENCQKHAFRPILVKIRGQNIVRRCGPRGLRFTYNTHNMPVNHVPVEENYEKPQKVEFWPIFKNYKMINEIETGNQKFNYKRFLVNIVVHI